MEKSVKDLLVDELHDILSSEEQIIAALPGMAKASNSAELKKAFESHLKETKGQVKRLEKIFKILKEARKEKFCKGTKGLIQEGKDVLKEMKKSPARDAALISKAQRIEHYEISAYGTARAFAQEIELKDVAALLQETLEEEENADKKLTSISEGGLLKEVNNASLKVKSTKSKPKSKPKPKPESSAKKRTAKR